MNLVDYRMEEEKRRNGLADRLHPLDQDASNLKKTVSYNIECSNATTIDLSQ